MHPEVMNEVLEELLLTALDSNVLCLQELCGAPTTRRWTFKGYAVFVQDYADKAIGWSTAMVMRQDPLHRVSHLSAGRRWQAVTLATTSAPFTIVRPHTHAHT